MRKKKKHDLISLLKKCRPIYQIYYRYSKFQILHCLIFHIAFFSDTAHVGSGVPQGTVLGPILFLCYINDLPSSVSSDVRLFADDCLLYRPIKSKDDQKKLQEDLTKLERWADIWGMKFNPSNCSVLRVKRPRAKEIASDYQLKGVTLGQVTNSPYLGVSMISENLEWGDHISKIASKAISTLGFLRRNLKRCPSKKKRLHIFQWFGHFWNTLVLYGIHTGKVTSIN